jgi:hypothetical protein
MAGDWIKMRVWLRKDPKVIWMSTHLAGDRAFREWVAAVAGPACLTGTDGPVTPRVTRDVTPSLCVTGLLEVWGTAREQALRVGDDLVMSRCTLQTLDDLTGVPGFGRAMASVGWAVETGGGTMTFPKFFEEKGSPEQRHRTSGAERQRRYRQRQRRNGGDVTGVTRDVTGDVTQASRVTRNVTREKRREEKSTGEVSPVTPLAGPPDESTDSAPSAPKAKRAQKPRPRDELFDALAEVTASDPALVGSQMGKLRADLGKADPPYTPEDVREFGRRFADLCPWAAEDGRTTPTLGELRNHLGKLRAKTGAGPVGRNARADRVPGRIYPGDPAAPDRPAAAGPARRAEGGDPAAQAAGPEPGGREGPEEDPDVPGLF